MKRCFFIVALLCFFSKSFSQETYQVDQKKLDALKKQAEAMKGMNRNAIKSNPDSALAAIRQMLKATDSIKNRITHEALKTVPQGARAEKYLNTKSFSDTTYTTVQFMGKLDQTSSRSGNVKHIAANCIAQTAPLVQHGSSFSVMLMSNEQVDYQANALKGNLHPNQKVKYVIQRTKMESHASLNTVDHSMGYTKKGEGDVRDYVPVTTTTNTTGSGKTKQFIFSFDTLTNIGQVSYLEELNATTIIQGGENSGTTLHQAMAGVSAVTDPKNYQFNALGKDEVMKELDKLTDGKLLKIEAPQVDEDRAILLVEKTKTGFTLTCRSTITKGDEVTKLNIIAYIGRPITEYEAIIKPVEVGKFKYEEWVPEGPKVDGSDDTKGDERLKFHVEVRSRKDPSKTYNGNFKVEWRLEDVTKYAGFCNNYPSYDESSDINFDLKFDPLLAKDPNYNSESTDGTIATTKDGKGKYAFVHVISMDYAAWGRLKAFVTLDDGSFPIVADPYYKKNLGYLTIPYDLDENKLADKWEKDNGVLNSGHPLNWDEDNEPKEQKENGDGYTLFEEYRGFAVHKPEPKADEKEDMHERTNPNKKDAFIYDANNLFKQYYEPVNPSKLAWHYLSRDKKQLVFYDSKSDRIGEKHRWINFNTPPDKEYTFALQYAMVLIKNTTEYPWDMKALGISFDKKEYVEEILKKPLAPSTVQQWVKAYAKSPQAAFVEVVIYHKFLTDYINNRKENGSLPGITDVEVKKIIEGQMFFNVQHEIGHYLGIAHHNGSPSDQAPTTVDGVNDCLMRYENPLEHNDKLYWLNAASYNRYCRKNEQGFWGSEDVNKKWVLTPHNCNNNCWGQITVKSQVGQ